MSEEFLWFLLAAVIALGATIWIYGWYREEIKGASTSDTLKNLKDIFWTNTPLGWMWNTLFGEKKKAKQAPPYLTNKFGHQIPISAPPPPGPRHFTAKKAAPRGFLTIPTPPPVSTYNTSSFNIGNSIGKPLVIKNWDRLAGMKIPMLTNSLGYSTHNWIVTHAHQTTDGYECMFENGGGFGNSNRAVTLTVYSDMYDSHRVIVKCGGRMSTMNIDVFKDPHNMLYRIANEFSEKFRL